MAYFSRRGAQFHNSLWLVYAIFSTVYRSRNDITNNSISVTFYFCRLYIQLQYCRCFGVCLGLCPYFGSMKPSFAAFLYILCPIAAVSVGWNVLGLNLGWTFWCNSAVGRILGELYLFCNMHWADIFLIQVCCILCAVCAILCQYVQFSVCTYKFVCSGYNLVNRTCNLVDSMYNLVYGTCI